HDLFALTGHFGEIARRIKWYAANVIPVTHKDFLKFGCRWSVNLNIRVTPFGGGSLLSAAAQPTGIVLGDVNTAGKRRQPVDDEQLAVGAMGQLMKRPMLRCNWTQRIKLDDRNSIRAEIVEETLRSFQRTQTVVDNIHSYPTMRTLHQRIRDHVADFSLGDNVHFEIDIVLSSMNSGKHGAVGLASVLQERNLVSHHQRHVTDGLLEVDMALKNIGRRFLVA